MISLMQMDYPMLKEPYFVSSFITGLKKGIKHYLIPQYLCDTYWKAKELEKDNLIKNPCYNLVQIVLSPQIPSQTPPSTSFNHK